MFTHHQGKLSEVTPTVLLHWFLLSFMAGNINAGGFIACGRFVSHVTGFATLAGVDFAHGEWEVGAGMLAVPAFFLLGVMISAYGIDRRLSEGKRPRYELVMGLVVLCLLVVGVGGTLKLFGDFNGLVHFKRDFFFMALLCMASGLTNAAITTSTGAFVRITHLTGITTDLGIGVVRLLAMNPKHPDYHTEKLANFYRAGNIFSFTLGSLVGAILFFRLDYIGFMLPAAVALYAMTLALRKPPSPTIR